MEATMILPVLFAICLVASLALFWLGFRLTRGERSIEQTIDALQGRATTSSRQGPAAESRRTATQISRG